MRTDLFDFTLPDGLIASHPVSPRDAARMLHVSDCLADRHVFDLPQMVRPGDVVVCNNSKVIPARLFGRRGDAKIEILLHRFTSGGWECFAKPAKRLRIHDSIMFDEGLEARVLEKLPSGTVILGFDADNTALMQVLDRIGHVPLPPYIKRSDHAEDRNAYQTVYAMDAGSVAAPTAGLHFTEKLLAELRHHGVNVAYVTLHVGAGTFQPVTVEDTASHHMHAEFVRLEKSVVDTIAQAKSQGGKVLAVGTTSLRTLESAASSGTLHPYQGDTNIFITPGYRFRVVDRLMTNFHLPRSTLFMLVCAFSGLARMQQAYAHAMKSSYRFYSYGDASLLERMEDA